MSGYYEEDTVTYEDSYDRPPPPDVSYPWAARWEQRDGRYLFVNEETGERTFDYPRQFGGGGGFEEVRTETYYDNGPQRRDGDYVTEEIVQDNRYDDRRRDDYVRDDYVRDDYVRDDRYGENVVERFDDRVREDRYRVEDNVEDAPYDAARWAGRQEQRIADIPQGIEYEVDKVKYGIEDIPEEIAGYAGRKVGDVEGFGDRIEGSYDDGRDERRYDDRW